MTNRFLISVAAVALIAGASAANAQGNMNREGGAATQQNSPATGGGAMPQNSAEPSSGMKSEQKQPGAIKGQRAQESIPGQKSKNQATENELKGGPKGNMRTEGREDRDTNMKAEEREGRGNKNLNAEERQGGGTKNLNAEGRDTEHATTGQAAAGAKLSTEQRTKITTVIRNEHVAPTNNVNFSISIGTRVPRERVELRPLPAEVFTIYPEWRGYEFFLVRDEIIVVDPRTLEIVAVLNA